MTCHLRWYDSFQPTTVNPRHDIKNKKEFEYFKTRTSQVCQPFYNPNIWGMDIKLSPAWAMEWDLLKNKQVDKEEMRAA